jgi:hypothetical protein
MMRDAGKMEGTMVYIDEHGSLLVFGTLERKTPSFNVVGIQMVSGCTRFIVSIQWGI